MTLSIPHWAAAQCAGGSEGELNFDGSNYQYCDGSSWVTCSGSLSFACFTATPGSLQYVSADKTMRFCNGAQWEPIKGERFAACTVGEEGRFNYDNVEKAWVFCDGSDWHDFKNCPSDWYDCKWKRRVSITVNSSQVPSTQTGFPVYVDLSALSASFFSNVSSDGSDILVTNSDGITPVSRELEYLDTASSKGALWFRADSIADSTSFYIYYDNPAASQTNSTSVWTNGYRGVWHGADDPGAGGATLTDSTSSNIDGTFYGSMNSSDSVDGKLGKGIDYDGTDDYVELATDPSNIDISGSDMTMCVWVTFRGVSTFLSVISKGDQQYHLKMNNGKWELKIANQYFLGDTTYTSANYNQWYHLCGRRSGTTQRLFVNGVLQTNSSSTATFSDTAYPVWLGRDSQNTTRPYYPGIIDDLTISNVARSDDWIATIYNNQSNFSSFMTVSSEATP